jgi:uncharacterized protein (TIGR02270 family)
MTSRLESRVVERVLEQHAHEAAFGWLLRDAAVSQPHYAIADLLKLDTRIDAHFDGLRIAGAPGWDACRVALDPPEPGEVFTAAVLAFQLGDSAQIKDLLDISANDPELARGVVSALGWLVLGEASAHIKPLQAHVSATYRRVGIAAGAIHRTDPGDALRLAVGAEEPDLRARALRAVGELARVDLLPSVERSLISEDPDVRLWAAWSAAVLSTNQQALSVLAEVTQAKHAQSTVALLTLMRRSEPEAAKRWQRVLAGHATTLRLAVLGAGAIGDPSEMSWLIDQMKTPGLARVAGESLTMITGVDIAYLDLDGERPDDFESGPTDDRADENVDMDPDENLPWPDPDLVRKWWLSNRHAFQSGTRYLLGNPITVDWCKQVLRIGKQRQRAAAALELAMRQPGVPLFEVRAPGFRQKRLLGL